MKYAKNKNTIASLFYYYYNGTIKIKIIRTTQSEENIESSKDDK